MRTWQTPTPWWLIFVLATLGSPAAALTLNATDYGWYRNDGFHSPANPVYVTGGEPDGVELRSFFVFGLPVGGSITAATLVLFNRGLLSPDATESFSVFDVSTDVASLVGGTGGVTAFTDLGSGVTFGAVVVSAADDGTYIEITLNDAALAALNSAPAGELFAFGGALTTIGHPDDYEVLFDGSIENNRPPQLLLTTTVPEPGTMALMLTGTGIGLLLASARWAPDDANGVASATELPT